MSTTESTVPTFEFEVLPLERGRYFDAFILTIPSLSGEDYAARRAWWSAFHLLGPRGLEPEDFVVNEWRHGAPGRQVSSGGFVL